MLYPIRGIYSILIPVNELVFCAFTLITNLETMFVTSHIHPMLVHFPIALGLVGFLFEFIELFLKKSIQPCKYGEYLLYLATFSAIASLLSGVIFTGTFAGKSGSVRDVHMIFAVIATFTLCITSVFYLLYSCSKDQDIKFRRLGFIFYCIAAVFITLTGAMGGTLVYNYMIGL